MATITDVARLAGVSNATVSHVINQTRKVNPETIARVEAAIQALNYRPNAQARSLKTGQSQQAGVIHICSLDPFFSEVFYGIERAASAAGYSLLLAHSEYDEHLQNANIDLLLEKGVDGLIINTPILTTASIERLCALPVPCLLLQAYDERLALDCIHPDDRQGAYDATRYLLNLGHCHIACIAGAAEPQHTVSQRQAGYRQALQEQGLACRVEDLVFSDFTMEDGYRCFQQLRAQPEPPSAFVAYSDLLALGALRAAADLGLDVPGDVSIIGFDDITLASYTTPRLTTVFQEKALQGQLAFERLHQRLHNPALPIERKILPTRLVIRESCGPAR